MLTAIAIDDEPMALEVVKAHASKVPFLELKDIFTDAIKALEYLKSNQVNLIFLDIKMPDISGLELATLIPKETMVVFTTAYSEHAVKSFELDAIDYLLKPFSPERFAQAISRFLEVFGKNQEKEVAVDADMHLLAEKSNRLVVRVKNDIKIIPVAEVSYFEAEDDYIAIHTDEGKFLKKMTMKHLEESLDPGKFARVHRSYSINLQQVTGIEPYERDTYLVKLRKGQKIPVSKTGYARLRQVLGL